MDQQKKPIHPAQAACAFMERAELRGAEVETFAQTYNWLQAILAGEDVVVPVKEYDDLKHQLSERDTELEALRESLNRFEAEETLNMIEEHFLPDTDPEDEMGEQGAVDLDAVG